METSTIVAIVGIPSSIIGTLAVSLYLYRRKAHDDAVLAATAKLAQENKETQERLAKLETQQALMTQSITPINTVYQAMLVRELTHYHTPEVDALLVKLGPPNTLTDAETMALREALERRTVEVDALVDEYERDAAVMLPYVIKRVAIEQAALKDVNPARLTLVSVAAFTPEVKPK